SAKTRDRQRWVSGEWASEIRNVASGRTGTGARVTTEGDQLADLRS
ncbi:MAG: hypothetical protein QOG46_1871, partial [Pseudonocardiales bacterium]|nr:hypothetical protein [Pseudonocardiales bacterium]